MTIAVRPAVPGDDVAPLWPALAPLSLRSDDVLVALTPHGQIVGGVMLFSGGHDVLLIVELTVAEDVSELPDLATGISPADRVVHALANGVLQWAQRHGIEHLLTLAPTSSIFSDWLCQLGATMADSTYRLYGFTLIPATSGDPK